MTADDRFADGQRVLERVRTGPRAHGVAVLAVVGIGLALAWLHWFGLVLGGALVGLVSPSVRRGVAGALGLPAFGALIRGLV